MAPIVAHAEKGLIMATKRVVPIYRNPDKKKSQRITRAIMELKRKRILELRRRNAAQVHD